MCRTCISWKLAKKMCISISTIKYEFIALDLAGQEVEWLRKLLVDSLLWKEPAPLVSLYCDSHTSIYVAKK